MKASEQAEFLNEAMTLSSMMSKAALEAVIREYIDDVQRLIKLRNASTDGALLSIFDELENKWNAMVRRLDDNFIVQGGFQVIVREAFPAVLGIWLLHKQAKRYKMRRRF